MLVICWHTRLGYLPGVDMPLFFLISGFFAPRSVKYSFAQALERRTTTLLGMTFGYLIFYSLWSGIWAPTPTGGRLGWFSVQHMIIEPLFYQPYQAEAGPLWFVPALWWAMVLWLLTRSQWEVWPECSTTGKIKRIGCLVVLFMASLRTPTLDQAMYMGWAARVVFAYCFFVTGFLLFRHKDWLLYGKGRWILIALAVVSLIFKAWSLTTWLNIDVRSMSFNRDGRSWAWLVSISGIALVFVLSLWAARFALATRVLTWLGEKSFHIMALHLMGVRLYWEAAARGWMPQEGALLPPLLWIFAMTSALVGIAIIEAFKRVRVRYLGS